MAPKPGQKSASCGEESLPGERACKRANSPASRQTPAAARPVSSAPIAPLPVQPPVMEDWWLVRDAEGHTGWLLSSRMDVDVPDEIGTYAEGQRYVGAYVLNKVYDPDSSAPRPRGSAVRNRARPAQIRPALRLRPGARIHLEPHATIATRRPSVCIPSRAICRFWLPTQSGPTARRPSSASRSPDGNNLTVDPATGITRPVSPRTITYEMNDTTRQSHRPRPGADPHHPLNRAKIQIRKTPGKKAEVGLTSRVSTQEFSGQFYTYIGIITV